MYKLYSIQQYVTIIRSNVEMTLVHVFVSGQNWLGYCGNPPQASSPYTGLVIVLTAVKIRGIQSNLGINRYRTETNERLGICPGPQPLVPCCYDINTFV